MPSLQRRYQQTYTGKTRLMSPVRRGTGQYSNRIMRLSPIQPTMMQPKFNPGQALVNPYRSRLVTQVQNKALQRGLIHLGLGALRAATPVGLTMLAFEIGYSLDWNNPFAIFQPAGEPGWGFAEIPGSRLCCKIGDKQEASRWYDTSVGKCTIFPCSAIAQVPGSVGQNPIIINSPFRYQHIVVGPAFEPAPGVYRMNYHQYWIIDRGSHGAKPPLEIPWNDGQPAIAMPVPYSPPPQPAIREIPGPYPSPLPQNQPVPRGVPAPLPYEQPSLDLPIDGSTPPRAKAQPRPALHTRTPPKGGDRETKEKVPAAKALKALAALYDKATEMKDVVDAIYDALPKAARRKQNERDMYHKMDTIYRNLGSLDVGLAIENLIYNHYEDKVFGKFYSYGRRAPFGAQLPGGTRPHVQLSQRT